MDPPLTPSMNAIDPVLLDVPLPIRTPRLLIRAKQPGEGAPTAEAVAETWNDLHQWMDWAERLEDNTAEKQEIRTRHVMAKLLLREEFNFVGVEIATGRLVVWCGFHSVNWRARHCDTGYWVRKSAQGKGFATESTNALLRFAFGPLRMQRVGLTHTEGNERSRRVAEKLGFTPEGLQRSISLLPGGRVADKRLYARFNTTGLPPLEVQWGSPSASPDHRVPHPRDGSTVAKLGCAQEHDRSRPPIPSPQDLVVAHETSPHTSSPTPDILHHHLRALEEQLLDPSIRANPNAVAALLTDGFQEFGSSGRTYTKPDILNALANESPSTLSLTDFVCQPLGPNIALVTYRSHRQGPSGTTISALRSSLWLLTPEGWRMHFHQGTKR